MDESRSIPVGPLTVAVAIAAAFAQATGAHAQAAAVPLQLETKIPLGAVTGRIDHMAIDLKRRRLFVAELGNDTIGIVDVGARKVVHRISGLKEPQGIGYVAATDSLYVANAGDGSVRIFRGPDYTPAGRIDLGDDADNIRVDAAANRFFVGYGSGAIGIIDVASGKKVGAFPLPAHPESFQLDTASGRLFVNVPNARSIAALDANTGSRRAMWPMRHGANFAMALDRERRSVLVVFRHPAKFAAFDMQSGATAAEVDACGDADDLFVDAKRRRVYISCGGGFLDVLNASDPGYPRIARIPTAAGARTSLFVPELDRLFVAVRARSDTPASIWIYRPAP